MDQADEIESERWDEQLDADSAAGTLDFLFDEAESEATTEEFGGHTTD